MEFKFEKFDGRATRLQDVVAAQAQSSRWNELANLPLEVNTIFLWSKS